MQIQSSITKEIRSRIRNIRRELPLARRLEAECSIYRQIKQHQQVSVANNIAIFLSFDGELDTKPIIEYFWQQQKSVFVPTIHPFNSNYMLFFRYDRQTELIPNRFGILQPRLDIRNIIPYKKLDIISLGKENAISLGIDYNKIVRQILIIIAILVALSTALIGPVGFLGLLTANLSYVLMKTYRHKLLLLACCLISFVVIVIGQFVMEHFLNLKTPLSTIINFIGGIYFMVLILKSKRL